jgi:hypothetical protein
MPRAKENFPVLAGLKSSSTGRGTLTLSFQIVGIKCIFCDEYFSRLLGRFSSRRIRQIVLLSGNDDRGHRPPNVQR